MSARPSALCATTAAVLLAFALPLQAADWHDFENQSLGDWLTTTTGGSGSTAVVEHNGSWMANVSHDGTWSHALSHDYAYNAASVFEFRMHAVSTNPLGTADAMSGVRVTFLNAFNVPLSSAGLFNTTTTSWLGANEFAIDNLPHDYAATMADWATLAGLASSVTPAKMTVSFVSQAGTYCYVYFGAQYCYHGVARVWFDNVGVIPEPATAVMLSLGLTATFLAARRRRRGDAIVPRERA